ncbi:cysteine--tRNA ligase [bacterium]|nr:cysteine--tRNA ligase [bacterium]
MSLHIYNTLTRQKEEFQPLQPGRVHIYVCGPTVYDYPHIGHAKSYISFDVVVRYFRWLGYRVRYVQNITDVGHMLDSGEDRILKGAAREQIEPMELVEKYTAAYFKAMDQLNVLRPDISPRASGHIPEQIELVQKLLQNGYAYEVNGSVYFDVSKWTEYGKLSGRKVEEQMAGARLDINEEKRHPADFALWKKAAENHLMQWNSPWGRGFPGWHIECSAMSAKYLGETFDIHGGGMENQFPHHECEIAQSEAANRKPFVRYWMHNNMVLVDGVKMSKSLGNFTTIAEALKKFSGEQIRFFILQSHYRSPVDFSDAAIAAAAQGLDRLRNTRAELQKRLALDVNADGDSGRELAERHVQLFRQEMDDDFNTPAAIGRLFDFSRDLNRALAEGAPLGAAAAAAFEELYVNVLGLGAEAGGLGLEADPFIDLLVSLRNELRQKKEWALADRLRDGLASLGVQIKDGKQGATWTRG